MVTINPYLNFNGNCEEAFNFYKAAFGGEFEDLQRYKDGPLDSQLSENEAEWIMHVSLPIGQGTFLMGSDRPSFMGSGSHGNNNHIIIQTETDGETDRIFKLLSAGGHVTMPLEQTFWGARYGAFTDQFGVQWMINQPTSKNV